MGWGQRRKSHSFIDKYRKRGAAVRSRKANHSIYKRNMALKCKHEFSVTAQHDADNIKEQPSLFITATDQNVLFERAGDLKKKKNQVYASISMV